MNYIRQHKWLRVTLRTVLVTLAVYLMLIVLGMILAMDIPRVRVKETPAVVGLEYQNVTFPSRDTKIHLKGWFLPASGENTIIIVHGGYQNRVDPLVDTLHLTRDLVGKGYNVLLFDLRGRGQSEGKARSLMYEEKDIGGAVDYLKSLGYPVTRIGVIGYCSGAASTVLFASREKIGGIVLDGCFAELKGMIIRQALEKGIPEWILDIFYDGLKASSKIFYGFTPFNPVELVPQISSPILFIHGQNDILVTAAETQALINAAKNPLNQSWEVPGVNHSEAYRNYPEEYVNRLDIFFKITLK